MFACVLIKMNGWYSFFEFLQESLRSSQTETPADGTGGTMLFIVFELYI